MQFELIKDKPSIIKVIGVGGGGSNAVNHMYRQGIKGVEFLVCNTDSQALDISPVPTKIQLGPSLTEGRGAGSIAEVGKKAAIETMEEIKALLDKSTKMVFVTAGMGGGTGTGAAPIIAGLAKEMGILTVGIVTVPFNHEGKKRRAQAELGIEELKKNVDALLIICNDKLREIHGNLQLSKAFAHADDILAVAAKSIAEIITVTMQVNVDFADIETVMKDSGVAIMGASSAEGEHRAMQAAEKAIDSPLLNDNHIEGARYILLNITSGEREATMDEVGEITDYIQEQAGQTADIIMGIGTDMSLGDKIGVTIIATGFKTNTEIAVNHQQPDRIVHVLSKDRPAEQIAVEQKVPVSIVEIEAPIQSMEPFLIIRETEQPQMQAEQKEENSVIQEVSTINTVAEVPSLELELPLQLDPPLTEQRNVIALHDERIPAAKPQEDKMQTLEEDMFRNTRERLMKIRETNFKLNSPNGILDLEKEPAYKRRNIQLDSIPSSSDSNVSRYTLSIDDKEKKIELRPNNPFLHDRVD